MYTAARPMAGVGAVCLRAGVCGPHVEVVVCICVHWWTPLVARRGEMQCRGKPTGSTSAAEAVWLHDGCLHDACAASTWAGAPGRTAPRLLAGQLLHTVGQHPLPLSLHPPAASALSH